MDKQLFKVLMEQHRDTQGTLAGALGLNRVTIAAKVDKGSFTQKEIKTLIKRWDLKDSQVMAVFFN